MNSGASVSRYASIASSNARAARPGQAPLQLVQAPEELALQLSLCDIQDLSFRDQHHIQRERRLVATEAFSQPPLGAVAAHRPSDAPVDRQPQPARPLWPRQRDQPEQGAFAPRASAEHQPEVLRAPNPFARAESLGSPVLSGRD